MKPYTRAPEVALAVLAILAGCASRQMAGRQPHGSPASPEARAAAPAVVTKALQGDPTGPEGAGPSQHAGHGSHGASPEQPAAPAHEGQHGHH